MLFEQIKLKHQLLDELSPSTSREVLGDQVIVTIPPSAALQEMARQQQFNHPTTHRGRSYADLVSLYGRFALLHYLGDSTEEFYDRWKRSLNKGDGGRLLTINGLAYGLRSTKV